MKNFFMDCVIGELSSWAGNTLLFPIQNAKIQTTLSELTLLWIRTGYYVRAPWLGCKRREMTPCIFDIFFSFSICSWILCYTHKQKSTLLYMMFWMGNYLGAPWVRGAKSRKGTFLFCTSVPEMIKIGSHPDHVTIWESRNHWPILQQELVRIPEASNSEAFISVTMACFNHS